VKTQRVELPALDLRADVHAESVDVAARTVDVIFSTGAPVERYDWRADTRYLETLSLKPKDVRLKRLNNGAPFLNTHSAWRLDDVLGVVVPGSARIAEGQARATVRFSSRADVEPIWQDVRDGIVRHVSVGYRVHRYEQQDGDGKIPIRHAVDWEPYEISAVPMGADDDAKVRSEEKTATNPCEIVTRAAAPQERAMEKRDPEPKPDPQPDPIPDPEPAAVRATETPDPATPNDRDAGADAERKRIQGILRGCEAARLPHSFANKLIEEKHDLETARGMILDTLRRAAFDDKGPRPGTRVAIVGADPLENVWRGITGALLHRIDPVAFKLDDNARQYRMHSLLRAAEECLEQRGTRTRGFSKMEIAGLALGLSMRGGMHGAGDFANILADVAGKSLRRAYEEAPQTFSLIARRIPMPDFKPVKRNQLGEAPQLAKVLEHGEFQRGTVAEGKEQFALATYGKIFGITRKALVNDDLDAFGRLTTMFGRSARNLESDLVWAEILRNANMGDGVALFHANHGNLAGGGGAIDVTTLGTGRAAMRNQKGLDAKTYLNISARYLIVPPGKETIADQFVSVNLNASQASNVNPFSGRLTVVTEPRLEGGVTIDQHTPEVIAGSATAWYLAATPEQIDIIEWGFLDGEEGPTVESRIGFDVDGLEIKCRHDFAAKVIDYRGLYKNPGA
jgi:hypothetical protein